MAKMMHLATHCLVSNCLTVGQVKYSCIEMLIICRLIRRHKRDMLEHRDKYRAGFLHGRSGAYAVHAVVSAAAGKDDEAAENACAHADIWCETRNYYFYSYN